MTRWVALSCVVLSLAGFAGACASILGIHEPPPEAFEHRAHVLKGVACVQCHKGMMSAGETGTPHIPTQAMCLACHKKPHNTGHCLTCHSLPSTARRMAEEKKYVRFRHDLHLQRLHGNCVRCHIGVAEAGKELDAPMGVCLGCHAHQDQFKLRQCNDCHVDLSAEAVVPKNHIVHDEQFLQRHGTEAASAGDLCTSCHKESFCAQCHGVTVPDLPSRIHFDDVMRQSMHRAGFMARHPQESRDQPALCSTCHTDNFCRDCHERQHVAATVSGSINPHPPGWAGALGSANLHGRAARRDPASCAACHGGTGEMLCVSCHKVGGIGGSPHPSGWSSRKPLSDLPCRLCHTSGP